MDEKLCTCGRSSSDQCWQCCQMRDGKMSEIGNMTYGLRDNAKDICDIWFRQPQRRSDFGPRELLDIRETVIGLQVLLREIDKQRALKVAHG